MLKFVFIFLFSVLVSPTAAAQDRGLHYGDGLRYYAMGDYEKALEELYRAYGLKASDDILKLIVQTHDLAGQCDAVDRQLAYLKAQNLKIHPSIQRCIRPGTLDLQCSSPGTIRIGHAQQAFCNSIIKLPAGKHVLHSNQLKSPVTVHIESGKRLDLTLELAPVKQLIHVPALNESLPYTAIKSPDGLFEIWVRSPQPLPSVKP